MIIARFYTPYKRTRMVAEIFWGKDNSKSYYDWIKTKNFSNTIIFEEKHPPWKVRPQIMVTKKCSDHQRSNE